jgi:hypothetical protein
LILCSVERSEFKKERGGRRISNSYSETLSQKKKKRKKVEAARLQGGKCKQSLLNLLIFPFWMVGVAREVN